MKKSIPTLFLRSILVFICTVLITSLSAQTYTYEDAWGSEGFELATESSSGVTLNFSINQFFVKEIKVNDAQMKSIQLPSVFLPNNSGSPDLPGIARYIAIPKGASVKLNILESRTETFSGMEVAPAPVIPKDTEDGPLVYEKDQTIYRTDAFYPARPIVISEPTTIRGVDVVLVGVTPFQYNPVTKELIVHRDIRFEIDFLGGTEFGDTRLRSRWFDPILRDAILNFRALPEMDYNRSLNVTENQDYEYVIISPDDPTFLAWADSIKNWRTLQGIRTGIFTTNEIGGNTTNAIESFINNAYNNWAVPPVAVLIIGDYGSSGNTVISPIYDNYCASDHIYADVNGNHMADLVLARMTAQTEAHLSTMVNKVLRYESNPPTNPDYYAHPITAMGWQTERWFQLCSEVINGFWEHELGKQPVRENAIYSGTPGGAWSTNTNTSQVVNYFGPSGTNYIPSNTSHLTDWGGNATRINNDINSGAFMLQHRDHGLESGWGEPYYRSNNLSGLNNEDLTFVFSVNCLTGKFNYSGEVFAERFHRMTNGALGLIAASEVSYSFVNDAYVWGMYDFMWPQFMPSYGTDGPENILPAFANVAGKYFLQQSSWPYNTSNKEVTYYLFHDFGDAFSTVYSEVPQALAVTHNPTIVSGATTFDVIADAGSFIALTVDGEILATAEGTGSLVSMQIPFLMPTKKVNVTITKQNYYRYSASVDVVPASGPYVINDSFIIDDASGNGDGILDYGENVLLNFTVKNVGIDQANNVDVFIGTDDIYVTLSDTSEFYGAIPADSVKTINAAYSFEVSPLVPDGHNIGFRVRATDGVNTWISYFSITAQAPTLELLEFTINDALGNSNGKLDPGETADLYITMKNTGSSDAADVVGSVLSADTNVTINTFNIAYGILQVDSSKTEIFSVTADENSPAGHRADFAFEMNGWGGVTFTDSFFVIIGQIPALIIDLDENHNSAGVIQQCLTANQINSELSNTFVDDLQIYSSVFLCLGIYSNNTELQASQGDILKDYLLNGGMLYMEGGDTWYFDDQTSVHPMFNISASGDGSGDLNTLIGQPNTAVADMSFSYSGENNWIDRLNAVPPAEVWFKNTSPSYGAVVAYDGGIYKTIGASFEYGGLNDGTFPSTKDELMNKIIEFFELNSSVPVELTSFVGSIEKQKITLKWITATETNNFGFEVERSDDKISFSRIGNIEGKGTTTEKQEYTFVDAEISKKGIYYYRLKQIDHDGTFEYSNVIEVEFDAIPVEFSLSQNYPNPFNPSTTIKFGIPEQVKVSVKIYDILGKEVHTLVNQVLEPAYYEYDWSASQFASGVYFYRIEAGKFSQTKKLMLLK